MLLSESRPPDLGLGVHLSFRLEAGEVLYGWGEQFGAFARTGGRLWLHAVNTPSILQRHRSYSAVPFFLSRRGYGVLLLNASSSRWHIDPRRRTLSVEARGGTADYLVILGETPKEILTTYTASPVARRCCRVGPSACGPPATRRRPGQRPGALARSTASTTSRWTCSSWITTGKSVSIISAGAARSFPTRPPDRRSEQARRPPGFDPDALPEPAQPSLPEIPAQPAAHNLPPGWNEPMSAPCLNMKAARSGLLGSPGRQMVVWAGGMLDFANPSGGGMVERTSARSTTRASPSSRTTTANTCPNGRQQRCRLAGANTTTCTAFITAGPVRGAAGARRPPALIYARSVWAGSQRYPALFLGDQKPTLQGMRSTLRAGLNLGLAGFAYWTADVFGLDGQTTPEMHMRYAQWALFSPDRPLLLAPAGDR